MSKKKKHLARIVLIHGVRISNRNRKMHRLAIAFRESGFCVVIPTYGYLPAFLVGVCQWLDRRIAGTMSAFIQSDDILLGHSNGATLVYMISKIRKIRGAVLINAALEVDKLPDADFVHIYYNNGDCVARWSSIIPFHPWGSMGGEGFKGRTLKDVLNIDQGNPPESYLPKLNGHSDIFSPDKIRPWGRYIASRIIQKLSRSSHV